MGVSSLTSTGIGKAAVAVIVVLLAACAVLGVLLYGATLRVQIAESDKNATQVALDGLVDQLQQNYEDYQRRLGESNQTKTIVTNRYYQTIQNIDKGGDVNETCDDAMRALDAYQF